MNTHELAEQLREAADRIERTQEILVNPRTLAEAVTAMCSQGEYWTLDIELHGAEALETVKYSSYVHNKGSSGDGTLEQAIAHALSASEAVQARELAAAAVPLGITPTENGAIATEGNYILDAPDAP